MTKQYGDNDANRDPISGKPGAHPVGVGAGAAAGGAAGAAIGSVVGPVGTVVGATIGAVAGGLAGKSAAEAANPTNPTVEDAHWRSNYNKTSYYETGRAYNDYEPAYRTGYEGRTRYTGKRYEEVESDLERDYNKARGNSTLAWDNAKHATKDAWHRVERTLPGDADNDGR